MSVIYIKDEEGKFIPLPTIKGADNTNIAVKGEEYIYFKKNCPDWSEPRIYFFNNHTGGIHDGTEYDTAYSWDRSPYMLYDETTGYYYYPISRGYDSVIFFCDSKDKDGWNYKTNICHIPSSTWYSASLFVQSEIGYDGFWADYNTKMAKLLIQHNPHNSSLDPIDDTKITDASCIVEDSTKELSIKDFGMNVVLGDGEVPNQRSHYEYIEFPINAKSISFTFNEYDPDDQDKNNRNILFSRQIELNLYEVCYIYPVIYLQGVLFTNDYSIQGTVSGFNAASDSVLFPKLFSNRDHSLIEKDLDYLKGNLKLGTNNDQIPIEHGVCSGFNSEYPSGNVYYTKIGDTVTIYTENVVINAPTDYKSSFQFSLPYIPITTIKFGVTYYNEMCPPAYFPDLITSVYATAYTYGYVDIPYKFISERQASLEYMYFSFTYQIAE